MFQDAHIRSVYNLCSHLPFEELAVSLTSVGTLSLLVVELVASPGVVAISFLHTPNPGLVPAPTSAYSLSTAVT